MPLNCVIRGNFAAIVRTNTNFLDDDFDRTPLIGRVFNANAYKVHSYIVKFIFENAVAEQNLLPHKDAADGRVDYFALKELYEGVGGNAKAVLTDKKYIQELFYGSEKPPHMWWENLKSS